MELKAIVQTVSFYCMKINDNNFKQYSTTVKKNDLKNKTKEQRGKPPNSTESNNPEHFDLV